MVASPQENSLPSVCSACGMPTDTAFCENCGQPQTRSTAEPQKSSLTRRLSSALWSGRRKWLTVLGAVVVAALVAGSVVFVTQAAILPASASTAVSEGQAGSLATSGVRVDFGAHTFSGKGTLTVKFVQTGGIPGVRVSVAGASLSGPATLTFPYVKKSGEPAPLVGYSASGRGPLALVGAFSETSQAISIKTDHVGTWSLNSWSTISTEAEKVKNASEASPTPPVCAGAADLQKSGITFTQASGSAATSCVGESSSGAIQAVVTNPGALPALVELSGGLTVGSPDPDYASLGTLFPYIIAKPLTAGDTSQFIPPGGSYTFGVTAAWGKQVLQTRSTGASALAFALVYASRLKDAFASRYLPSLSARGATKNLASLAATACLKGLAPQVVDAPSSSASELADVERKTISAATACIPAVIAAQGKQDDGVAKIIANGFAWLSKQQGGHKGGASPARAANTTLTIAIPIGYGYTADDPKLYGSPYSFMSGVYLLSPSQNISCGFDPAGSGLPDDVGCQIFDYSFTPPADAPSCDGEFGSEDHYSLSSDGTPVAGCAGGVVFGSPGDGTRVLPYGHSVTYKNVIFLSDSTGLTALNTATGHGFKLSRSHYTTY